MTPLPFRTPQDAEAALPRVSDHLAGEGLLAYPTETVYGLGSRSREADVLKLATLKGRSSRKPFLLLASGRDMVHEFGLVLTGYGLTLAEAYWPGPLTLVLRGAEGRLPDALRGPEGGIAVRVTSHPLLARLIGGLGYPITSTSANRPGGPPEPGVGGIIDAFRTHIESGDLLVLDGGTLGNVPPSTVVDCTGPDPRMIRSGAVPSSEISRCVGRTLL